MLSTQNAGSPIVDDAGVSFSLADPTGRLAAVRLAQEVGVEQGLDFARRSGSWELRLSRPPVDRMEYLIEITDHNDQRMTITDPGNPLQVDGAFGPKSVVQFPDYRAPAWLMQSDAPDTTLPPAIDTKAHDATITGMLWSPVSLASDEPAPMLLVHDGPEYAKLGSFTHYLGALIGA